MWKDAIIAESIYKQANLEGIKISFTETQEILNNVNVVSLTPINICKIYSLEQGWNYLFDNLRKEMDIDFLKDIHNLIARFDVDYRYLGKIREDEVMISGTSWRPEIPSNEDIDKLCEMLKIDTSKNITDQAINIGLYIMRMQPFKDGNKRVGSYAMNKILIEHGKGIFNVPVELDGKFKQKLVEYYESDDNSDLKMFVAEHCIDGTHRIKE